VIRERDRLVFVCFSLQLGSLLAVSSPALRETYLFVSGIAYLGLARLGLAVPRARGATARGGA